MVTTNATVNSQTNSFQGTGVTLTANQAVTITAYGNIYYDTDNNLQAGPDGVFPNIYPGTSPIPSAGHASLIGQVGNVKFAVGSSYSGAPGSGSLTLRVNDTVVADNQGSFYVQIIRETDPCPNYNPAAIGDPIVYKAGQPLTGPGAEVKAILAKFGIVASATCSCNARAAQMDAWGMGGCLKRIPEITGWLREEAEKRGLWFCAPAGVALILLAISLAALKRLWQGNNK
jgi:hypothetical protein